MANSTDGWKHVGEVVTYIATGIAAAVGARKFSSARKSSVEEAEPSGAPHIDIYLDRISRTLDAQGVYLNDQNIELLRAWSDIRWVKKTMRELSDRVSDLESKSKDTT